MYKVQPMKRKPSQAQDKAQDKAQDANHLLSTLRGVKHSEVTFDSFTTMVHTINALIEQGLGSMAQDFLGSKLWRLYLVSKLDEVRYTKEKFKCNIFKDTHYHSEAGLALEPIFGLPVLQNQYRITVDQEHWFRPRINSKMPWSIEVTEGEDWGWVPFCSERGIPRIWAIINTQEV